MSRYELLSRDELETRLALAEDVCAMFGWAAVRSGSDRDDAIVQLWQRWSDVAPSGPSAYPHLSDERIADLADERRDIRARTLARLSAGSPS